MLAVLARMAGENTPAIDGVLCQMLSEHLFNGDETPADAEEYIRKLKQPEDGDIDDDVIADRLAYFLSKTIKLMKILERELKFIRLFWESA